MVIPNFVVIHIVQSVADKKAIVIINIITNDMVIITENIKLISGMIFSQEVDQHHRLWAYIISNLMNDVLTTVHGSPNERFYLLIEPNNKSYLPQELDHLQMMKLFESLGQIILQMTMKLSVVVHTMVVVVHVGVVLYLSFSPLYFLLF
jgi:hypothetical protein